MFARQTIFLSPWINEPEPHELGVRIAGSGVLRKGRDGLLRRGVRAFLAQAGLGAEYFPDRLNVTKAQFGFGWDFAPRVLTCGIWDDIRVVLARGAYIEDIYATPEPLNEGDPTPVRWQIALTIHCFDCGQDLRAEVSIAEVEDGTPIARSELIVLSRETRQTITFDAPSLWRWWPWDQGEPRRYRLVVRLSDEKGPCDEKEVVVGVRTVARERLSTGAPWRFTINGRYVFLRGANWVPADILPGTVKAEDYARLVAMAADAGINYLRVWGGGLREKAAFYDECDRCGVLVSQEFPLACTFLDHYPRDRSYLTLLETEATGIVRALRNHPSLLAWCGGNEISPRRERLPLRTIERVLEREDASRPWIPASPSEGDVHNWDVWHGFAPWQEFETQTPPFMSEFGLQALPDAATLGADMPPELDHPEWAERKLQVDKLRHYLGPEQSLRWQGATEASQRTQAAVLQTGIEACRVRREGSPHPEPCGGVAFWQFNEPWTAVSWSVVDRAGRPKAAYEMLKRSYAPLLVAALFVRKNYRPGDLFEAEVWLVNDAPDAQRVDAVMVELELDSEDGKPVGFESREILEIGEACALQIDLVAFELAARPRALRVACEFKGEVVARNEYDLTVYLPPQQPVASRILRRAADWLLQSG
jgi:beta-mannosidase